MNTPKTFNSCLSITLVFISFVSMSGCAAFDAHLQQIAKALGTKADWNAVRYTMYCEKLPNGRAFDQARREIEAITPIIVRGGLSSKHPLRLLISAQANWTLFI